MVQNKLQPGFARQIKGFILYCSLENQCHGGIKATNRILAVDKDMKLYNTPEFRLIQDSIGAFTTRSYEKFLPTSDVAGQVRMIK